MLFRWTHGIDRSRKKESGFQLHTDPEKGTECIWFEKCIEKRLLGVEGKAPLEKIITNVYPFEDAAKAFADFANNPGDMLKVVFDFSGINK